MPSSAYLPSSVSTHVLSVVLDNILPRPHTHMPLGMCHTPPGMQQAVLEAYTRGGAQKHLGEGGGGPCKTAFADDVYIECKPVPGICTIFSCNMTLPYQGYIDSGYEHAYKQPTSSSRQINACMQCTHDAQHGHYTSYK